MAAPAPSADIAQIVDEIAEFLKKENPKALDVFESVLARKAHPALNAHLSPTMNAERVKNDPEINSAYIDLIARASNSNTDFLILKDISSHWVACADMPAPIKEWLISFLSSEFKVPPRNKGKKTDYQKRMALALAAFMVIDKGFPAGKNDQSAGDDNAFSIVVMAAHKAGWEGITYNTVCDYFYKMQHLKSD